MRLLRAALAVISVIPLAMTALSARQQTPPAGGQPAAPQMRLTSTSFPDGAIIPIEYTQAGEQISPALAWVNAPPTTVSFVLHMHDIDPVRNKTTEDQLHWLIWNMPPTTTSLPEGVPKGGDLPDGSHQTSATGPNQYRGPGAAAAGPLHHYIFEILAIDMKVEVPPGEPFETRAKILNLIQGHIVGRGVYSGLFHRPE